MVKNKKKSFVFTMIYIILGCLFLIKESKGAIDHNISKGIQYGIIFLLSFVSLAITICIYFGILEMIVKLVIDINYDKHIELYSTFMLINLIKIILNLALLMVNYKTTLMSVMVIVFSNIIYYLFFKNININNKKCIFLYFLICVPEIMMCFWR